MEKDDFDRVYDILEKSFISDEIRSREGQKSLFEDAAYKVLVNEEKTAFMCVWNFHSFRFIEHIAVDEDERNKGIGGNILEEYALMEDTPLILEVELPGEEISDRRIAFYERHGFKLNGYDYIQPPMEEGKNPVPLRIMSFKREINRTEFEAYRKILYNRVYGYK